MPIKETMQRALVEVDSLLSDTDEPRVLAVEDEDGNINERLVQQIVAVKPVPMRRNQDFVPLVWVAWSAVGFTEAPHYSWGVRVRSWRRKGNSGPVSFMVQDAPGYKSLVVYPPGDRGTMDADLYKSLLEQAKAERAQKMYHVIAHGVRDSYADSVTGLGAMV